MFLFILCLLSVCPHLWPLTFRGLHTFLGTDASKEAQIRWLIKIRGGFSLTAQKQTSWLAALNSSALPLNKSWMWGSAGCKLVKKRLWAALTSADLEEKEGGERRRRWKTRLLMLFVWHQLQLFLGDLHDFGGWEKNVPIENQQRQHANPTGSGFNLRF